jgi:hypothetical protein
VVAGDGAYYLTTTPGTFGGVPFTYASGGSATTLNNTNQDAAGAVTQGTFTFNAQGETLTQAVTGATAVRLNTLSSTGTITGSVTSGTIGASHTMTQAVTGVTCASTNAPTGVQSLTCNAFSGTADNSHIWTDGTTSGTYTPTAVPSFSAATLILSLPVGTPDNSHDWVGGTTAAHFTPTAVPVDDANWTVNAFVGMLVSNYTGTNLNCYGTITANTAQTITVGAGWVTKYPFTNCPGPALGTSFATQPAWNHGVVTSGTATLTYQDDDVIGTCSGCVGFIGRLEDVVAPGGRVSIWTSPTSRTVISNLVVSRSDWLRSSGGNPQQPAMDIDWDVRVISATAIANSSSIGQEQVWAYPSTTGIPFTGALHKNFGAKAICWSTGTVNSVGPPDNTSANEICVGGRSDAPASTTTFRNRFEVPGGTIGGIGPATPFGTNQAGTDVNIFGGGSTGSGTGGTIKFWTGDAGSSGTTSNSGTARWQIAAAGHLLAFADNTYDIGAAGATRPRIGYFGTAVNSATFRTATSCAASGTAANPSVVACSAAAAGIVYCDVAASAGTCTINTTAVTTNSSISITPSTADGTLLSKTCNTAPSVMPAILLAAKVNATSFTLNMPTGITNGFCFEYSLVN